MSLLKYWMVTCSQEQSASWAWIQCCAWWHGAFLEILKLPTIGAVYTEFIPSTRSLIGFWHELLRRAASQLKANQRFIKQAILYFIGSCELEAPQYYTQAWHCIPHHTPLILASPRVPLATNNTPHNIRGTNAVPHAPSIRLPAPELCSSLVMFTPGRKTGQVWGYRGQGQANDSCEGEDVSPWHLFVSGSPDTSGHHPRQHNSPAFLLSFYWASEDSGHD